MPLGAPGLETLEPRLLPVRLFYVPSPVIRWVLRLLDVAAQVKLAACEGDDAVETCLHLRGKIAPRHQALCLRANRFLCLHEVSLFQFAGVVVCHEG